MEHKENRYYIIITLCIVLFLKKCECETVNDIMTSLSDIFNETSTTPVEEVEYAKTIILVCRSNDKKHLFLFWQLPKDDIIVGPSNNFDAFKYNYEILSGNLTIRQVSYDEEGVYHCISKGVVTNDINIRSVKVAVKGDEDPDTKTAELNYFRGVVVVGSLFLISGLGYLAHRVMKKRQKKETLLEIYDDDDSGDEIFRAPGTSKQCDNVDFNRINEDDEEDTVVEIPKISIDFEDILQNTSK